MNKEQPPSPTPHLDPKLVQALIRGGSTTLTIGPVDISTAKNLRHRLYRTRAAMRRTAHQDLALAEQATVALREAGSGQMLIIVYPSNQLIDQALRAAGIVSDNEPPPLE